MIFLLRSGNSNDTRWWYLIGWRDKRIVASVLAMTTAAQSCQWFYSIQHRIIWKCERIRYIAYFVSSSHQLTTLRIIWDHTAFVRRIHISKNGFVVTAPPLTSHKAKYIWLCRAKLKCAKCSTDAWDQKPDKIKASRLTCQTFSVAAMAVRLSKPRLNFIFSMQALANAVDFGSNNNVNHNIGTQWIFIRRSDCLIKIQTWTKSETIQLCRNSFSLFSSFVFGYAWVMCI